MFAPKVQMVEAVTCSQEKKIENFSTYITDTLQVFENVVERDIFKTQIQKFLRLCRLRMELSEPELVYTMVYVDEVRSCNFINSKNVGMLLVVSLILAQKYLQDVPMAKNKDIANDFGITLSALNQSEMFMLERLGYNCNVNEENYKKFQKILNGKTNQITWNKG